MTTDQLTTRTTSPISDVDVDARFRDMIAAEWPKLTGRQTPWRMSMFDGDLHRGQGAVKLARRIKVRPMPWQQWSIETMLSKNDEGKWTHPECCLIVPRQNGKSLILSLRVIYGLFVLGENIVFSAQQWETAKALWKRTWNLVKSRPSLLKRVESKTCSQGRGTIDLANGARVVFTTRSANAGRGLDRTDLIIYDEAYDLTEADMAALSPTKMAADDPQTIYTSSAVNVDQHPNGQVLASVRRRGQSGGDRLFYAEWLSPEQFDRTDVEGWKWANPSFGVIQTVSKLEDELRMLSTEPARKSFDVEYLGRGDWPADADAPPPPPVDGTAWADLRDLEAVPAGASCLAVECEPGGDAATRRARTWSVAAAVRTARGKHVQLGWHGPSTPREVALLVAAAVSANDPVAVVLDGKSLARDLLERELEALGIGPEFVSAPQVSEATNGFLQEIDDQTLSHDGDPRLAQGMDAVGLREIGRTGGLGWARPKGSEISQVIAATNAVWGLDEFDVAAPPAPSGPAHKTTTGTDGGPSAITSGLLSAQW